METDTKIQIKLDRLKKRSDFLYVQGKDTKWVSKGMVLQAAPNREGITRAGFTVTKRISKKAVVRNRIKRRLRAVAADILPFYAAEGYDYILVGRADSYDRPYNVLKKDLKWCLARMGLFENRPEKNSRAERKQP